MHITFKYHSEVIGADDVATGVACFNSWIYEKRDTLD